LAYDPEAITTEKILEISTDEEFVIGGKKNTNLLNLLGFIETEYLNIALKALFSEFLKDSMTYFESVSGLTYVKMCTFIFGILLISGVIFHNFIKQTKKEIQQTKGMLNVIPTKLLLTNQKLQEEFIRNQV
jgi:hypothetical protein